MKLSEAKKKKATKTPESKPKPTTVEIVKPSPKEAKEGVLRIKEIIRPKQKDPAGPAVGAHLPPEPAQAKTAAHAPVAEIAKPSTKVDNQATKSKKVGGRPCEVVDCKGSDDMMNYEGRIICATHFNELCSRRDLNSKRNIELDDVVRLQPRLEKPKKAKGHRADPDSPWTQAKALIPGIIKAAKSGGISLPEVLDLLLAGGWSIPATNNTVRGTLHTVLTKMVTDGDIVKIGRGKFGPTL